MALKVKAATRVFTMTKEDGDAEVTLPDPGSGMSANEVRKFYAAKHPELTNATITGPVMKNDQAVYSFATQIGDKG